MICLYLGVVLAMENLVELFDVEETSIGSDGIIKAVYKYDKDKRTWELL